MHVIVVSNQLARARSLTLTLGHFVAAIAGVITVVLCLSWALFYFAVRNVSDLDLPMIRSLVQSVQIQDTQKADTYLRENLNAMAVKVGQMQAQLMRLDALGERLSTLAGFKPHEFRFNEMPGRGGALSSSNPPYNLSITEFRQQLDALAGQLDNRNDQLGMLEARLFDAKMKKRLMPTIPPVDGAWNASSFGWRIDPITGMNAFHDGIDFIADVGTPIYAAAGGMVTLAEMHHQYWRVVEIDHGNDFVTRYAHASKIMVKQGDVVHRGRKIAEVGSSGRSTGPHLHFEVRYKGASQNPNRFLQASASAAHSLRH